MKKNLAYLLLSILAVVVTGIKFPAFGNITASVLLTVIFFVILALVMLAVTSRFSFNEDEILIFSIIVFAVLGLILYFVQPIDLPGLTPVLIWAEFVIATSAASLLNWLFSEEDPTYYINIG